MTVSKPVPPAVLALIRAIAERLPEDEDRALVHQAERAAVLDEVPGRMLDVRVPEETAPLHVSDGPVEPIPALHDESGNIVGELLIWVTGGRLVGVERPWFTDVPPED
jgi:hypothetical protein